MTDRETIGSRLEAAASLMDGVTTSAEGDDVSWIVDGIPFAVLTRAGVELRLDPPIADAATRTPDTDSSPRGAEWVRFHPRILDGPAVDRLDAWFALARRRAAQSGSGV